MVKQYTKEMIEEIGKDIEKLKNEANEYIDKHETGANRSADCKGYNYWLISPIALRKVASLADRIIWENAHWIQCLDASINCKYLFLSGETIDWIGISAICIMAAIQKIETGDNRIAMPSIEITPPPFAEQEGKANYHLLPFHGLESLAKRHNLGATNYGIMNWENGFPISDLQDHSIRHIRLFQNGDRSDDHLGAALWGDFATIHSYYKWPHLNKLLRGPGCSLTEEHKKYHAEFKR